MSDKPKKSQDYERRNMNRVWTSNTANKVSCRYCACTARQPYQTLNQYERIDSTTNQNPPYYKLGPEPYCYRPLYNHTIGYLGVPTPYKINYRLNPWLAPP